MSIINKRISLQHGLQRLIQVVVILLCLPVVAGAQVKLGNNVTKRDSSAALEIESQKQSLLLPRINDTNTIVKTVKDGALIYFNNNSGSGLNKGLYVRSNNKWNWLQPYSGVNGWNIPGNSGINGALHFLGTLDKTALTFKTNNVTRMFIDSVTGYVGFGTSSPQATLHNQGSTLMEAKLLPDFISNVQIGLALNTVDSFTVFNIAQTSASKMLSLPNPTVTTPGRIACIANTGSAAFTVGATVIKPGTAVMFTWNNPGWIPHTDGLNAGSFPIYYRYVTTTSLSIGPSASTAHTGAYNVSLGANSLYNLVDGTNNVGLMGADVYTNGSGNVMATGNQTSYGSYRVAIGGGALKNNNGTDNLGIGTNALGFGKTNISSPTGCTAVGYNALSFDGDYIYSNNTAIGNSAIGPEGGINYVNDNQTAFGSRVGLSRVATSFSAAGANTLFDYTNNNSGFRWCVALGFSALNTDSSVNSSGNSGQLLKSGGIGALAQVSSTNGGIVLGSSRPEYATNVGIGLYNPQYKVHVNGNVFGSNFIATSDRRLKTAISPVANALQKVMAMNGVYYCWKTDLTAKLHLNMDSLVHIGFIAQDIEKVLPEVVRTARDSFQQKAVSYTAVIPVITEAIKQQQPFIEELQKENAYLQRRLRQLQHRLNQLEKAVAN